MKISVVLLILDGALTACSNGSDPLAKDVSERVERLTMSPERQEAALRELEAMGGAAVPFIVSHLGDIRPLAEQRMSLVNQAADAFEGSRHYSPQSVHDALSALLNQITGESFEFVYNGATAEQRTSNQTRWVAWCKEKYRERASYCAKSI
jgi:hypothetical protein